ncbi:uridine diphosphate glucose pyrophosphatase NUDT14-like [Anopheles aquasalis]|nr:uridine diphosphate glucose pyrophosphatase NUDT14-like [Anopheles aquasalis]
MFFNFVIFQGFRCPTKSCAPPFRICLATIMNNITDIHYGPLPADSPYVKPFRFHYTQNGKQKSWDLLKVHDSVSIVIFNVTRRKLVFVKQFRPAVYHGIISGDGVEPGSIDMNKYPPEIAVTMELCAGIIDKPISIAEIAREEILEECGYDVPVDRIEQIIRYRSGVGTSGAEQTLFYTEVTDADKVSSAGGGVDDEIIDVVEYGIEEARQLTAKGTVITSPPSFLFGLMWFLANRAPKDA